MPCDIWIKTRIDPLPQSKYIKELLFSPFDDQIDLRFGVESSTDHLATCTYIGLDSSLFVLLIVTLAITVQVLLWVLQPFDYDSIEVLGPIIWSQEFLNH